MGISSIISFPDRGPYGNPKWRGNTSGRVVKAFLEFFRPSLFVDPCEGGGTSRDVATEMGIEYVGLDLHSGFNLLRDRLIDRLPREADYVWLHPPYSDMILYSGNVWGDKPHPDDLSRVKSHEEFMEKLQVALVNCYEAIRRGGHYSVQIGDMRRKGEYYSFQSDIIQIAPGVLEGIVIKAQHNVKSDSCQYSGKFIPIAHEYILNFRKDGVVVGFLDNAMKSSLNLVNLSNATWKAVVRWALKELGGKASLDEIYEKVEEGAQEKAKSNPNWRPKVRQVLQMIGKNEERGVWALPEAA